MGDSKQTVQRRTALAGAGALGAVAAAAALLPGQQPVATQASAAPASGDASASGGYRLTEHIQRYYASARI
jgi:hypothetical protein